jgi:hypothetical protein
VSETQSVFKKPRRGEKGPNLLSIKKPKKRASQAEKLETLLKSSTAIDLVHGPTSLEYNTAKSRISGGEEPIRRKRQRKHNQEEMASLPLKSLRYLEAIDYTQWL